MHLREIARMLQAEVVGNPDTEIRRVAKIEEAEPGDITFLANVKYSRFLATTRASAVIVGSSVQPGDRPAEAPPITLLRVADPYLAFLRVLVTFSPPKPHIPPGIHPSAVIEPGAVLGTDVRVGANAVVSEGCRIGDRVTIGPGTVLGEGVEVGADSLLYANVTVREGCKLGARVIIQPGAVIGSDGFGFAPRPDGSYEKIPQVGIVVLEDDVEIGANTTVDRATMGETRIKRGVKLDNLIQVAHNVVIGEDTVMAAQVGISGSTKIGRRVQVGGQVGFTGHLEIGDGVRVGAQSGVHQSLTSGAFIGSPTMPQREAFRVMAALQHVPDALHTLRSLQEKISHLERLLEEHAGPDAAAR